MRSKSSFVMAVVCLLAAGCATTPGAPQSQIFAHEPKVEQLMMPLPLPPRPKAAVVDVGGVQMMCLDEAAARDLAGREETLLGNTDIAVEAVNAYGALRDAHHTQHQQARILEAQYNATAQRLAEAEAQLDRERREAMLERWLGRALLIIAIGAGI